MYKNLSILAAAVILGSAISSCTEHKEGEERQGREPLTVSEHQIGKRAVAIIKGVDGSEVNGTITFEKVDGGVRVVANIKGLKPGSHGFHIHEKGDCGGDKAANAGGHFNPTQKNHGASTDQDRHAGDLGNVEADSDGNAKLNTIDQVIVLEGTESIVGKSVIIHEKEDDFVTQPTGNAGGRVACGVITTTD